MQQSEVPEQTYLPAPWYRRRNECCLVWLFKSIIFWNVWHKSYFAPYFIDSAISDRNYLSKISRDLFENVPTDRLV